MAETPQHTFYDYSGKPVVVDDPDAAAAAFKANKIVPLVGADIPVFDHDENKVVTVKANDLNQALDSGRMSLVSDAAYRKAQLEARYGQAGTAGGLLSQLAAGSKGALRGLTLGASDWAEGQLADTFLSKEDAAGYKKTARELKELHPVTSFLHEIGGNLAGSLLDAPLAGAGKVATGLRAGEELATGLRASEGLLGTAKAGQLTTKALTPAGLLDLGGGAVEHTVGSLFGGGSAARGIGRIARTGAEGALFGAADSINEQILAGDPKLNGQKILSSMGTGALFGTALGVGAVGASKAWSLAKPVIGNTADKLSGDMFWHFLKPSAGTTREATVAFKGIPELNLKGGTEGLGKLFGEKVYSNMGTGAHPDSALEHAIAAWEKSGQELGKFNEMFANHTINGEQFYKGIEPLVADLSKGAATGDYARDIHRWVNTSLADRFHVPIIGEDAAKIPIRDWKSTEIPLKDLMDQRLRLDETLNLNPLVADTFNKNKAMQKLSGEMESQYMKRMDELVSAAKQPELMNDYKRLKYEHQGLGMIKNAAEDAATRYAGNNTFGLGDMIAGIEGLHYLGPMGAISGLVSRYVRTRGPGVAASVLAKLADMAPLAKATQMADERMARATNSLFGIAKGRPKLARFSTAKGYEPNNYDRKVSEIMAYADPEKMSKASIPGAASAPNHSSAITAQVVSNANYLKSQLPVPVTVDPLFGKKPEVNLMDKMVWMRKVHAVEDPIGLLEKMHQGTLTVDEVHAVQATSPELFDEMKSKVMVGLQEAVARGKPVPYQKQLQLTTFFGVSTNPTTQPDFVKMMQANNMQEQTKANALPKGNTVSSFAASNMTELDRREAGLSSYAAPPQR